MTGYSGTTLVKKLGVKEGFRLYLRNAPANYFQLLAPLPVNIRLLSRLTVDLDMVHFFTKNKSELRRGLKAQMLKIKQGGMIWVSWPKKSSGVASEVTEDVIREVALPMGLVDIKVCAVDETWSALKLVIRKENRK